MTNKTVVLAGSLAWALLVHAAPALDRSDVLFHASLDGVVRADLARGSAEVLPGYEARFTEGLRGQAAVVGPDTGRIKTLEASIPFWLDIGIPIDYTDANIGALRYAQQQNLDHREGTLSFWVKPLNWHPGDGKNHFLAHMDFLNTLSFVWVPYPAWTEFRQTRKDNRDAYFKFPAYPVLSSNAWQNITVCWRGNDQWTYMDGQLRAHQADACPGHDAPGKLFAFGESGFSRSAFDEVMVLARAVDSKEATALFYRAARSGPAPLMTAPETKARVTPDGALGKGEYDQAVRLVGWTDDRLGLANDDPTEAYLTYDNANLYVAFRFPVPAEFRANPTKYVGSPVRMQAEGEDADVMNDDHFEVTLAPAGSSDTYTFRVNARGARYDARNGDPSWDGHWQPHTQTDHDYWTMELAFPFDTFGLKKPAPGAAWRLNLKHQAFQVLEYGSTWAYSGPDPKATGRLVFGGATPAVRVTKAANPGEGQLDAAVAVSAPEGVEKTAWTFEEEVVTTCLAELNADDDAKFSGTKALDPTPPAGFKATTNITVAAGKTGEAAIAHQLAEPLAADFVLRVKDANGQDVLVHRRPFVYSVNRTMDIRMLPSQDKLRVQVDAGSLTVVEKGLAVQLTLKDAGGKTRKSLTIERMPSVKHTADVAIGDLQPGAYTLVADMKGKDALVATLEKPFEIRPKPEWWNSNVGETDEVLPPWTPMETDGNSMRCWGRTYRYEGSVFPAAIEVLGEPLLAAPMALTVTRDGKRESVQDGKLSYQRRGPARIEYTVEGTAGGCKVKTVNWVEYDGLIWVKLSVAPQDKSGALEEIALEVPYRREIATHWFNGQYRPDSATGYVPAQKYTAGPANKARFGTPERGLQWCWEENYRWQLAERDTAMELIPEKDRYRVRLKFLDHPVTLTAPLELEFGLQALPCRPQPKGYHGPYWGASGNVHPTATNMPLIHLWAHYWHLWNNPNLTPEQLAKARERILRDWRQGKRIHCTYSNHSTTSPMGPEYRYFCEEWRPIPSSIPNFKALDAMDEQASRKDHSANVCYGAESYADFYCYYLDKSLRHFRGRDPEAPIGLYYDNSGPRPCGNPAHGHGVLVDGEVKPIEPILAWRQAGKRIRKIIKDIDPDSWLTVHMSGNPLAAYWSFYDIMIPGEQYAAFFSLKKAQAEAAGEPWPYDYTRMMQLDRVRAECSSQGYGPAQVFLSETWQWAKAITPEQQTAAERHLFGLLFVNDVMSWGNDSAKSPVLEALWTHLGWDDEVEFIPYWRNQQYLNMTPYDENRIVASIFKRRDRACLFAFNNTDEPVPATFHLKLAELGVLGGENGALFEPLEKQTHKIENAKVTVTLPARDFRLLIVKPEE